MNVNEPHLLSLWGKFSWHQVCDDMVLVGPLLCVYSQDIHQWCCQQQNNTQHCQVCGRIGSSWTSNQWGPDPNVVIQLLGHVSYGIGSTKLGDVMWFLWEKWWSTWSTITLAGQPTGIFMWKMMIKPMDFVVPRFFWNFQLISTSKCLPDCRSVVIECQKYLSANLQLIDRHFCPNRLDQSLHPNIKRIRI